MRLFVFGMGYSAQATARALSALVEGPLAITGTSRTGAGQSHVFDGTGAGPTLVADLRAATHVILSIPPDREGDPALNRHRADLDAAPGLEWIGYFSTVGVYGDSGGDWIDEDAPTRPANERSRQRVLAEAGWRDYAAVRGLPLAVLRLAGIYGPGRSTFDKLRDGTARRIVKPGQVFNRIHVEDIGRLAALAALQRLDGTFNVADHEPAPPQDLVTHAATAMGMVPPPEQPFDSAELTPMQRSFYADNKRVSNRRLLDALAVDLLYPTYREGLDAILRQGR